MKLTIFQPHIPHYREEFFVGLANKFSCKIFCFEKMDKVKNENFKASCIETRFLKSFSIGNLFFYNPIPFLKKDSGTLILMLDFKHITTWLLLLTKIIHCKKIILWGQGISIKRFLTDEKKTLIPLKWFLSFADGVWFYTENELKIWKRRLPKLNALALNNTISGIDRIVNYTSETSKEELKKKYGIIQKFCLIYSARFENHYRRTDLLLELIQKLDSKKYAFIIIGDGKLKPDFSKYTHVYDFGSVYEPNIKDELFSIADIYFQPGWVGLSIVEAMGYGRPVFTFERSEHVKQCVEYSYLIHNFNSIIFKSMEEIISYLDNFNENEMIRLSKNAKLFVKKELLMDNMIQNAMKSFEL